MGQGVLLFTICEADGKGNKVHPVSVALLGDTNSFSLPSQCCAAAWFWGPRGRQGVCLHVTLWGSRGCWAPDGTDRPLRPCTGRTRGQHLRESGAAMSVKAWAQILVNLLDCEKWYPCCENENMESFRRGSTARNHWLHSLDLGVVSVCVYSSFTLYINYKLALVLFRLIYV